MAEILYANRRTLGGGNAFRFVTLVAGQPGVSAEQRIAGFAVVESLGVPIDQVKVVTIVIGMAAGTVLRSRLGHQVGMQSAVCRHAARDLGVALQTFKRGLARSEFVARHALRRAFERFVRSRQGTW